MLCSAAPRANSMCTISKLVWKYSPRMTSSEGTCNHAVSHKRSRTTARLTWRRNMVNISASKSAPAARKCARAMSCMWLQLRPSHLPTLRSVECESGRGGPHLHVSTATDQNTYFCPPAAAAARASVRFVTGRVTWLSASSRTKKR
jgi:hypothetical protein